MSTALKSRLQAYFDGNGFDRWSAIYGGESVSRVRTTIREGHTLMLEQASTWLAEADLPATPTLLDAGCGTGLFSIMMAQQGFNVTGVDIAPRMVEAARKAASQAGVTAVTFKAGDIETVGGTFDAVACFDVLVHYPREPFKELCTFLAERSRGPILLTYAPHSTLLAALHWIGGRFPQKERRTTIQMTPDSVVETALARAGKSITRTANINHGFYHVRLIEAQ